MRWRRLIAVELRHLRYFLAVAEELNVTRAARVLYISQPTLSQQIRALEKTVGGPLFHRDPDGLRLTPAGHALLQPARQALAAAADGLQAARDASRPHDGVLRVGLAYGAAGELTQPMLAAFATTFPQVQLWFHDLNVHDLYHGLLGDKIDVAFTRLPLDPERHAWDVLFAESLMLGMSARHVLAGVDTVTVDEILALPMPNYSLQPATPDVLRFWTLNEYRNDCPPRRVGSPIRAGVIDVAHLLARDPTVIAPGPELLRRQPLLLSPDLHTVTLEGTSSSQVVAARRRHDRRPAVVAFCQIAATVAHSLGDLILPDRAVPIVLAAVQAPTGANL
jgi:DNA-binding transcriptional LysR family regulator